MELGRPKWYRVIKDAGGLHLAKEFQLGEYYEAQQKQILL